MDIPGGAPGPGAGGDGGVELLAFARGGTVAGDWPGVETARHPGFGGLFLEPLWVGQRAKRGANYFAVLVDNSRSFQLKDSGATQPRAAEVRELLNPGTANWLGSLEEEFQLRRYYFDSRLQATRDFTELDYEGNTSALGVALAGYAPGSKDSRWRGCWS